METIKNIQQTYDYLQSIYNITKEGGIKTKIKSESHRGHNQKSLLKYDILIEDNGAYKWNTAKPDYRLAYQFYNYVRNKRKTYGSLLAVIRNPNDYPTKALVEAITIKGLQEELMDKNKSETNNPKAPNLLKIKPETTNNNKDLLDELNNIMSKITDSEEKNKLVVDIMEAVLNNIDENTLSVKNVQSSISVIIAIAKNNQKNIFDIAVTQYHLLKELYLHLDELSSDNPEILNRKNIIGEVMLHMKKRVDSNNNIDLKYGKS